MQTEDSMEPTSLIFYGLNVMGEPGGIVPLNH